MDYRRQSQAVYYTRYHLVFGTKYRRRILKQGMGAFVIAVIKNICRRHPEIEFIEGKADEDHIHLLLSIPPKMSVSTAVNVLKSNSARVLRAKFPFLNTMYDKRIGIWADGYFVSTSGLNEDVIASYIKHQGEEDSGQAKLVL